MASIARFPGLHRGLRATHSAPFDSARQRSAAQHRCGLIDAGLVLLVYPERDEAEFLRNELAAEGLPHPVVIFSDISGAKDYLNAATLARTVDARYLPCVVLLDEKLGESQVRSFVHWLRLRPVLSSARVVTLSCATSDTPDKFVETWGTDKAIAAGGRLRTLAGVISRSCR
jgi:hypothetical protein